MRRKILSLLLFAIIIALSCNIPETDDDNDNKTPAPDENPNIVTYYMKNKNHGWTVRQPAEWEPCDKVIISYNQQSTKLKPDVDTTVGTALQTFSLNTTYDSESNLTGGGFQLNQSKWYRINTVDGDYYRVNIQDGKNPDPENYFTTYYGDGFYVADIFTADGSSIARIWAKNNDADGSFEANGGYYYIRITCFDKYAEGNEDPPFPIKVRIESQADSYSSTIDPDVNAFGVPFSLIEELANTTLSNEDPVTVQILSSFDPQIQANAKELIEGEIGIYPNIEYIGDVIDSYWVRDYGPWTRYDADGTQRVVWHLYDQPAVGKPVYETDGITVTFPDKNTYPNMTGRVNDLMIPNNYATLMDIPLVELELLHVGGNYMTDGQGVSFQTNYFYDMNRTYFGVSDSTITSRLKTNLGLRNIVANDNQIRDVFSGKGNHHIDCWSKIIDVDKILIAEFDPTDTYKEQMIQTFINYLNSTTTSYGTKYTIYRIGVPDGEAYGNGLIFNRRYFMPQNHNGDSVDLAAIDVIEGALPGFDVVPVDPHAENIWLPNDALHCRTKEVADPDMLYIELYYVGKTKTGEVEFTADIESMGGATVTTAKLYYNVNDTGWTNVDFIDQGDGRYFYSMPDLTAEDTVSFYYYAEDSTDRKEQIPLSGQSGPFEIVID